MADHHDLPSVSKLPDVHDEAADTPMWVPAVGLGLLVVVMVVAVYSALGGGDDAVSDAGVGDAGVEIAAPAEGAAPGAAPAPVPAQVPSPAAQVPAPAH